MESKIIEKESKIKYPCIMESNNLIIAFSKEGYGIVLFCKDNPRQHTYTVGAYLTELMMSNFKLFDGEIILSN